MYLISGGQTGADRGGLGAGIALGLVIGGWCPKGRRAEDGRIPDRYPLIEHASSDYLARTEQNVIDSHATIVFTVGKPTGGSLRTVRFAALHRRPCLVVELQSDAVAVGEVQRWLLDTLGTSIYQPDFTINVAGNRESRAPGIEHRVREILVCALAPILNEPARKRD